MWNSDCGFLLNCEGEFWEKMKGLSSVVHCDGVRKQPSSLLTWETALVRKTSRFKQTYSWTPKVVTYCCDCALKSLAPFFFLKVVWKLLRVEERGVNCGSSLSHLGSGKWLSTWKPSRTKLGDKETQLGHPQLKPATCTSSERASCSQLALHLACGVWQNRNVECVYKVAVIAEICQHRCLRKFQRIEVTLTVATPLGQLVWTLGRKLASEHATRDLQSGKAEEDAPLPHRLTAPSHWTWLHPRCSFVLGWPRTGTVCLLGGMAAFYRCIRGDSRLEHDWSCSEERYGRPPSDTGECWARGPPGTSYEQLLESSQLIFWLVSGGWLGYLCPEGLTLPLGYSFSLHSLPSFFLGSKYSVLKLLCAWCMDDYSRYLIFPAQEFWRNSVKNILFSLFHAFFPFICAWSNQTVLHCIHGKTFASRLRI